MPDASVTETETAEGSASDEADVARGQSASGGRARESRRANTEDAVPDPSVTETETGEGSASDEPDAARGQSEAEGEPASEDVQPE